MNTRKTQDQKKTEAEQLAIEHYKNTLPLSQLHVIALIQELNHLENSNRITFHLTSFLTKFSLVVEDSLDCGIDVIIINEQTERWRLYNLISLLDWYIDEAKKRLEEKENNVRLKKNALEKLSIEEKQALGVDV